MIKTLKFSKSSKAIASDEDILQSEKLFGFTFPSSLREFCRKYNGGLLDDENNYYCVPEKFSDFHAEYSPRNLDGFSISSGIAVDALYGLTTDPHYCNLIKAQQSLVGLDSSLFPIGDNLGGNRVFISMERPEGDVFFRDHELWSTELRPILFKIADSLEEFYNGLGKNPFAED